MRSIYIRNLFKGYLKKKWIIIVGLIVFVLIFGFLGLRRAYPERLDPDLAAEIEEYNEAVATYDDAIAEIEANIVTAQEQLDTQQEYIDNSLYMQLDPEAIRYASELFIVNITEDGTVSENNTRLDSVLSTMKSYFDGGDMKAALEKELGFEESKDLASLLSVGTEGNAISVSVKHFDMDEAVEIADAMAELLIDYKPVVEEELGISFTMTSVGKTQRVYTDSTILSTQNTNRNNLRTYRTNLSDLQTKLVTQQTNRKNYIEQYAPTGTVSSPRRTILMYGAVGVIAGIIVPLMIYAIYYTLSGRIKGKEELQAADLNVLALYRPKKGFVPSLEKAAVNLSLLSERNKTDRISLCTLGESPALEQVEKDLTEALKEHDLQIYTVQQGAEDAESLRTESEIGNHVLIVEAGRTTYTQLEEQIQFCESLGIEIWGCIVIE